MHIIVNLESAFMTELLNGEYTFSRELFDADINNLFKQR